MEKVKDAKQLIAGAQSFFHGFSHRNESEGLGEEKFVEDWKTEGKDVWMFSGATRVSDTNCDQDVLMWCW